MSYKPCSARDGNTCETPGSEIIGHCIDCDCLTLEEQEELANMFEEEYPCSTCRHRTNNDWLNCTAECICNHENCFAPWEPEE